MFHFLRSIVGMVVMSKRYIVVAAYPPDFGVSDGNFFFFDQRGGQCRGSRVLRSSSSFFDEVLSGDKLLEVSVEVYDKVGHAELVHDREELHLESGLHITGDMFDSRGDEVSDDEWRVYDHT